MSIRLNWSCKLQHRSFSFLRRFSRLKGQTRRELIDKGRERRLGGRSKDFRANFVLRILFSQHRIPEHCSLNSSKQYSNEKNHEKSMNEWMKNPCSSLHCWERKFNIFSPKIDHLKKPPVLSTTFGGVIFHQREMAESYFMGYDTRLTKMLVVKGFQDFCCSLVSKFRALWKSRLLSDPCSLSALHNPWHIHPLEHFLDA